MMGWAQRVLSCVLLLHLAAGSSSEPHYFLMVPAEIHFPHTARACIHLAHLTEITQLRVTLHLEANNVTLLEEEVKLSKLFKCLTFQVPLPAGGSEEVGQMEISLQSETHKLQSQKKVLFKSLKSGTFVQTDKAVYKPGQIVKFRIVTLNEDFIPIHSPYPRVTLQDPNHNRIGQWLNVSPQLGIVDLSFHLASEPAHGTYTIKVGDNVQHRFTVEEYVLPKFEILIELPKVITILETSFKMQVCARYTYGKPVQGRYWAVVCRNASDSRYDWDNYMQRPSDMCMTLMGKLEMSGCFNTLVEVSFFNVRERTHRMSLDVEALVTEVGTDVTFSSKKSCRISSNIVTVTFEDVEKYYHPGIPYTGRMKLTSADGSPMKGETLYLFTPEMITFVTDDSGRAFFSVNTSNWGTSHAIKGSYMLQPPPPRWNYRMVQPKYEDASLFLNPFYSKSKSFLKVNTLQGALSCKQTQDLQVEFIIQRNTLEEDSKGMELHYLVISKGGIIHEGTTVLLVGKEEVLHGTFSIQIPITAQLAPLAKVLVYTVFPSGEVVAGTTAFKISKCFKNQVQVTLGFSQNDALPGSRVTLQLKSAPSSLCSVRAVDKSMVLMKPEEELTWEKVYNLVSSGDFGGYPHLAEDGELLPCLDYPKNPEWVSLGMRRAYYWWDQPDVYQLVKSIGLKMITNANIWKQTKCSEETSHLHQKYSHPSAAGSRAIRSMDDPDYMMLADMPEGSGGNDYTDTGPDTAVTKVEQQVRTFFPETWIWDLMTIGDSGRTNIPVTVPDTITEWVARSFCLADHGFGMSSPVTLKAFKPFFVELALPYSVVRGESFTLKATVFNYLKECIKVQTTLGKSEELQVQARGDAEYTSCLCADEGKTFYWLVKAVKLGDVNLTVTTEALITKEVCGNEVPVAPAHGRIDTIIKPVLVKVFFSRQSFCACVRVSRAALTSSAVLFAQLPLRMRPRLLRCRREVSEAGVGAGSRRRSWSRRGAKTSPGSAAAEVSRKPGGVLEEKAQSALICADAHGEASDAISLRVPENILNDTERAHVSIQGDIMGKALQNIDQLLAMPYGCGEQNMVKFAPNIYILQYLQKTGQLTVKIIGKAVNFLKSGYQRQLNYKHDDGSYSAFGKNDGHGNTWLTAFVVKSFGQARPFIFIDEQHIRDATYWLKSQQTESGCFRSVGRLFNNAMKGGVDDELSLSVYITAALLELGLPHNDSTVEWALSCLRASLPKVSNLYTQALLAYTFTIAHDMESRNKVLARLNQQAVKSEGQLHWERKDRPKPETLPYWFQAPSAEVEMTSYILLAYLSRGLVSKEDLETASLIVSWLSKQQNPYGGFSSTQDTVVALQALAKYAAATYSEKGDVNVTVKSRTGFLQEFHVDNMNRLLLQQAPLTEIPGEYTVTVTGSGCVYVQTTLRYNIPPPKSDATFKLTVATDPESCTEKARSKFSINVTTSYTGEREASNMALIEVKMLSGFIPVKSSARELEMKRHVKKVEIKPDQVTIYLDQVYKTPRNYIFSVEQENEVKNLKPATVIVYDYYEKDEHALAEYSAPCSAEDE